MFDTESVLDSITCFVQETISIGEVIALRDYYLRRYNHKLQSSANFDWDLTDEERDEQDDLAEKIEMLDKAIDDFVAEHREAFTHKTIKKGEKI